MKVIHFVRSMQARGPGGSGSVSFTTGKRGVDDPVRTVTAAIVVAI